VVLFESWHGSYSDSPRAISEELGRRALQLQRVWALEGDSAHVPDDVTTVEPDGLEYLTLLGSARYVISNNTMPRYFRKKERATYVQAWHGTPLKRIAFDIGRPDFPGPEYLRQLRRDVSAWDYLIAPNRFSAEIFRDAFRYDGAILETGYPRNDLLSSPRRAEVRSAVRAELGLDDDTAVVLYAPTWRDSVVYTPALDLQASAESLGDGYAFLLRAHQIVAQSVDLHERPNVRNVSDYPDITELYLAADVLLTDYSSAMFDFAVTGKPILFFTYDLEQYRDQLRGFYFDFEAEAPGPLLMTTDDVVEALHDLDAVRRDYSRAYDAFVSRFCELEDGNAAGRVIEAVFNSG
jgi:CDP-glycerol glycerophosphotransferase